MQLKNKTVQLWARRLHVYISMALLFVVLFFSITGITLNRPELFVSDDPKTETLEITMPLALLHSEKGQFIPDQKRVIDYITQQGNLSGTPSALQIFTDIEQGVLNEGEMSLDYKGPGYNATVFIDMLSRQVLIEKTQYGLIAVLNDLHKGRNSGEVWRYFIDISALLMIFFVITGVCLLLPKKKTFKRALKWTCFGSAISLLIFFVAVP